MTVLGVIAVYSMAYKHLQKGDTMLDKTTNRERVAKYRSKLFQKGFVSLTVYLDQETYTMTKFLKAHYGARRKTAKLISMAIQELFDKVKNA